MIARAARDNPEEMEQIRKLEEFAKEAEKRAKLRRPRAWPITEGDWYPEDRLEFRRLAQPLEQSLKKPGRVIVNDWRTFTWRGSHEDEETS
jgi:hypothetical protein